jgi:hypothetical protein
LSCLTVASDRRLRAEAFRKQVSRARFMFAKLMVKEVSQTLDNPTPERIKEELMELAVWEYIRNFLASERRSSGKKTRNRSRPGE